MAPGYEARSGDEFDATTRWRHVCARMQRPRVRASIKRQMRRRGRRQWKLPRAMAEQLTRDELWHLMFQEDYLTEIEAE